ncbi:hypothetical protein MYAER_2389 [Microcystis aeruginosa NIES-2549]|uniref:Uncharacterized protein n=1 Tax=Microcystis aeruginosa NIES-2549 TaxID=1641812 RepID=A0A0F6RLX1_MICAE|nr:hypothetical protein MYAER_2389 [Microcystis aeruginosa NIES-2549]
MYLTIEITALKGNICPEKTEYFLSFSDNCCHNQKQSAARAAENTDHLCPLSIIVRDWAYLEVNFPRGGIP